MILSGIIIAVLVSMVLILFRAVVGPTIFDRILAANSFGTYIVVLIALIGELMQTFFFIDVALIYAFINFITVVALLRYFQYRQSNNQGAK